MSHELRTPLNSDPHSRPATRRESDGNLTDKQVEFAQTIHRAGTDLLNLISDILDLSKIESGTVDRRGRGDHASPSLRESVERKFRHVAEIEEPGLHVEFDPALPRAFATDPKRLQQMLKNLLSNAFKFTEHGEVTLTVSGRQPGWSTGPSGPEPRAGR